MAKPTIAPPYREARRTERINKGLRDRHHQRRATETLRRVAKFAHNFTDDDESYTEVAAEFDELYDDD